MKGGAGDAEVGLDNHDWLVVVTDSWFLVWGSWKVRVMIFWGRWQGCGGAVVGEAVEGFGFAGARAIVVDRDAFGRGAGFCEPGGLCRSGCGWVLPRRSDGGFVADAAEAEGVVGGDAAGLFPS